MEVSPFRAVGNRIRRVLPDSIAEEMGIEPGDVLLTVAGRPVKDIIDYLFLIADEYIEVEVQKPDGDVWVLEIDKEYDEELGLEFESAILDHARSCRNKCVFCFIDQLPEGMRDTLYFKDDDSRLSFLQGNFVTLTNVSEENLMRMIDYNISPINVSIHTTNPDLRVRMLGNRHAGNVLERLKLLVDHRVEVNGQIVLCPGYNDGEELDRTLTDLLALGQSLKSIAIVPVGTTQFREGLAPLTTFTPEMAAGAIDQVAKWQEKCLGERGTRFVFISDEFFVLSGRPLPTAEDYEGYIQLENGVGLLTKLQTEVRDLLAAKPDLDIPNRKVTLATGSSAGDFMKDLCGEITGAFPSVEAKVKVIDNNFFGKTITVSGLIVAQDIVEQIDQEQIGDALIIPSSMLKTGEPVFLDNMTVDQLSAELGVPVVVTDVDGASLVESILGLEKGGE